ncbi:hypothetical protein DHL47_13390 [Streptococcus panodentis]|uniref:Cingulin n=2 Tax=Streptococcus panodentis TaxID=1581472 RepID=A0ABS5B0C2_9STRE|nr:hypothetical protein [Streptococcus panodentis]
MNKTQEDQLEVLKRQQYKLENKIEDLEIEYRQFKGIREDVMSSQGSALFHFKNLLDGGVTKGHLPFYQYLLDDIEEVTHSLATDFEEEDKELKKRYQIYHQQLDELYETRKKIEQK